MQAASAGLQSRGCTEQGLRSGCPSYNLSVSLSLDTSPSRGGLGNPVQFVRLTAAASHTTKPKRGGTPEAPLLGKTPSGRREMSRMRQRVDDWQSRQALTERLYGRLTFPLQAASAGLQSRGCTEQHLPVYNLRSCTEYSFISPHTITYYRPSPPVHPVYGKAITGRGALRGT